ncbi:type VII secretion protein EccB [Krasilnikovia cinnamomea]|uniref:Type VII secretion protein EccB n=1 Tax=Krasilnikovia cinnamomea TaxID=349313 RepID=A0A4Q7ZQQ6_9ACTN|nr:type VII secretion protein EccB [Krasilnikovia cinnamomea]RZU53462.1 type VII secretion protein EccB [Krasilnikovia cinnamomea]
MQTKRDQLQAHNFVVGRLRSALLHGDADALETPTRRFSVAAFAGAIVAALIVAGFGAYGFFFPGANTAWREPGTIIVEKETGTRYLYDRAHEVLRPVLNHASARLLVGADARIRSVSAKSLRGVRHGLPLGIPNAPDALPARNRLTAAPWLVCVTTAAGTAPPSVTLAIGQDRGTTATAEPDAAALVADGTDRYLIWNGRRLRVAGPAAAVALQLDQVTPVRVTAAWLGVWPDGPDLSPPRIPGRGAPGPTVGGKATRVGQVLQAATGTGPANFWLVLADGLRPLSTTVAGLVLADPASHSAYPGGDPGATVVSAAGVAAAPRSTAGLDLGELPPRPPRLIDPAGARNQSLCARTGFGPAGQDLVWADAGALAGGAAPPGADGAPALDRVAIAGGVGVLARSDPGPQLSLITDVGLRFPLSADAVAALGYADVPALDVPPSLLSLLPVGPTLDPRAAGA